MIKLEALSGLVVYQYSASWCGSCKKITPIMKYLQAKYPTKFTLKYIDVDKEGWYSKIETSYKFTGLPTVEFVRDGVVRKRMSGLSAKSEYENLINTL